MATLMFMKLLNLKAARKDRGHHQSLITACHNMTDRLYTDIAQIFLTTITKNNRKALWPTSYYAVFTQLMVKSQPLFEGLLW